MYTGRRAKPIQLPNFNVKWVIVQQDFTGKYFLTNETQIENLMNGVIRNQHITFEYEDKIFSGIVVDIDYNKKIIENAFKKLPTNPFTSDANELDKENKAKRLKITNTDNNNFLIIQYSRNSNEIVYSVIEESEIVERIDSKLVFININGLKKLADVHYIEKNEKLIMEEFSKFRRSNFYVYMSRYHHKVYSHLRTQIKLKAKPWFFVQYAKDSKTIIYAVINESDDDFLFEWKFKRKNPSPNLCIGRGSYVHQVNLLKRSDDYKDVYIELENLIKNTQFPIKHIETDASQQLILGELSNKVETLDYREIRRNWWVKYNHYIHHTGEDYAFTHQ